MDETVRGKLAEFGDVLSDMASFCEDHHRVGCEILTSLSVDGAESPWHAVLNGEMGGCLAAEIKAAAKFLAGETAAKRRERKLTDVDAPKSRRGANTKKNTSRKIRQKQPTNADVRDLCHKLERDLPSGMSQNAIAQEFAGNDERKAMSLLTQARRYRHLWEHAIP